MNKIAFLLVFNLMVTYCMAQEITASQKFPVNLSSGNEYTIETTINKGASKNFIMFSQPIPIGLNVTDIDCKGGRLKFMDSIVKITWIVPPVEESFTFTYKLTIPQKAPEEMKVEGSVFYIVDSDKREFKLPVKVIKIDGGQPNVNEQTNIVETKTATAKPVSSEVTPQKSKPTNTNSGKTYKIQIGAFSTKRTIKNVPDISILETDKGITKYFTGNFPTKEAALAHLPGITAKGYKGAFIVAFENGKIVK